MRRFSPIVIALMAAAALSAAAIMGWAIPPRPERALSSTDGSPARLSGEAAPSGSTAGGAPDPEGSIAISPERIAAEDIKVAPVKKGVLTRTLTVPGIITLNTDLVSRVPARVQGTVTEMRKRLGDSVAKGEVVAVLDSREVADAKSEYLTASVAYDLKKTLFERAQALWNKRISAEQQYLQAREAFLQAQLRLDLARQKLSALNLDPAEVEKAERDEAASSSGVSSLREYQIRSLSSGRVIERKV
ncbi:MAG TPA: efflux RND transporter periplasmic adaptor subunit, partial [Methylocella sp.]|nr:efflux RND transporter periplasmic adaptor subunit [Methylocella sp.]